MPLQDRGGERMRRKLADPGYAQRIAEIRARMREMDRDEREAALAAERAATLAESTNQAAADEAADGTPKLTSAVVRSAVEHTLRHTPGYIEQLEHDAAHPETATEFDDWAQADTDGID